METETSRSLQKWTCDVYISFRGETRINFTDHLYTALIQEGIRTFCSDDEHPRGGESSSQILEAIRESRISIVVFTKGYASSRWCLDDLVEIVECKHTIGQIVLPIFYDISPSDVRKQKGSFAAAFVGHEQRFSFTEQTEKVNKWREALAETADLSGWDLDNLVNGNISKLIQNIVEHVLHRLNFIHLMVAKFPVGLHSRVRKVVSRLSIGTNDVRTVGIHGMGGIGKTTIAKAVYNEVFHRFEGRSFLSDIKHTAAKAHGLIQLQERLLSDVLMSKVIIKDANQGINWMRMHLCTKRVLVVLDDVDRYEQLDVFLNRRLFGPGSRILITTRDARLLRLLEADDSYEVDFLDRGESLQLFCMHAFRCTFPIEDDYEELSNEVVNYGGGLPLALEVLGAFLFKRNKFEWQRIIKDLQKIPVKDINRKLEVSFDALDDDERSIFLDIACFFVGKKKEYVKEILDGRHFHPMIGLQILIERSLITINEWNEIRMHDLVRDMGREIVRQMSPKYLGKRSRIWRREDALNVLIEQTGTKMVEGLTLDVRGSEVASLSTESFTNMRLLKLLQISGVTLLGDHELLPKGLIWLCWHECPLRFLPFSFHLDNIVVLDMQHSKVAVLWGETRFLEKLKILNLSYSEDLTETPDFVGLPSLKELILEGCSSLAEVHHSVGYLRRLVSMNLEGCWRLKTLPQSICYLTTLKTLNITMCSQIKTLPEGLGDMESLTELLAKGTGIEQFPSSIEHLRNLKNLSLGGTSYSKELSSTSWLSLFSSWRLQRSSNSKARVPASVASIVHLSSLIKLDLSYCGLSESATSINLGSLSSLQKLNLSGNDFHNLPSGVGSLRKLKQLFVMDCAKLESILELPSSLQALNAYNCTSMERLSIQSKKIPALLLSGCQKLTEIQGMEGVRNILPIFLDGCNNLASNFKKSLVQALSRGEHYDIVLPGGEIPTWFTHHGDGSSLSFHVPADSVGKLQALVVWVICASNETRYPDLRASVVINDKTNDIPLFQRSTVFPFIELSTNHSWVNYIPFTGLPFAIEGGEELELMVLINNNIAVEKCGVHLIVKKPETKDSQWFTPQALRM